ncbi:MAG: sensor histidine kinase [Halobacteriota archaeon]
MAQGRVDLAQTTAEGDAEHLAAAADALDRIESIVEHALTLAREGETVGDPEAVPLAAVAADGWETVDTAAAELAIDTDREVLADPDRLRNLFENLVRNAVDHGGPNVTIRVGDLEDGFYADDDGPGIPEEVADVLFEPGQSSVGGARFEIRGIELGHPPMAGT